MKPASIAPGAWLASHDIRAYLDASADPLALGRAALAEAGGDLLAALRQDAGALRGEIVLAFLAANGADVDAVMRAAIALENDV